ncbi:hypothetical protein SISNIDRAFT_488170 [Sistotremastrum niveocremeum HHB9708]|uniref:Uncharacterized protein n=1 Tax=Sistotremastrum niveocremeum HHB9708 TaxID=1314777 RepID=A0A164RIU8_9AGAM|nr:hypothetical protein SISNIDRAFT_488170 [Sistotremastrum niveocremeum HHB9708]
MFETIPQRYHHYALNFCGTIYDWESKSAVRWQPLPPIHFSSSTARNGVILMDHAEGHNSGQLLHPDDRVQVARHADDHPVLVLGWPGVPGPHYPLVEESLKELACRVYNATKAAFDRLGNPHGPGMRLVPIQGLNKALIIRFDDLVLHGIVNVAPGHWQAEFSLLNKAHEFILPSLA